MIRSPVYFWEVTLAGSIFSLVSPVNLSPLGVQSSFLSFDTLWIGFCSLVCCELGQYYDGHTISRMAQLLHGPIINVRGESVFLCEGTRTGLFGLDCLLVGHDN